MTAQDPALTRALEDLTLQVNPDNIMAVYGVFKQHADDLEKCLVDARQNAVVGLCGGDPVSREAAESFNRKIAELLQVHQAHRQELDVAAEHLKAIALGYGHTEQEIADSVDSGRR